MLDITKMNATDAQNALEVLQWLEHNKATLQGIVASGKSESRVSIEDVRNRFYCKYTQIEVRRFLPMEVTIFTDETSLDGGTRTAPMVTIKNVADDEQIFDLGDSGPSGLEALSRAFGFEPTDKVWTLEEHPSYGIR